jgi:hypothetical protein
MTAGWFAVDAAAVAGGLLLALLIIWRWLRWLLIYPTAEDTRRACGQCAWRTAASALVPLAAALIIMRRAPVSAALIFGLEGFMYTLAAWWAWYWLRFRGSAGRGPAPTGRD